MGAVRRPTLKLPQKPRGVSIRGFHGATREGRTRLFTETLSRRAFKGLSRRFQALCGGNSAPASPPAHPVSLPNTTALYI